jgi:hypothetical protein
MLANLIKCGIHALKAQKQPQGEQSRILCPGIIIICRHSAKFSAIT